MSAEKVRFEQQGREVRLILCFSNKEDARAAFYDLRDRSSGEELTLRLTFGRPDEPDDRSFWRRLVDGAQLFGFCR